MIYIRPFIFQHLFKRYLSVYYADDNTPCQGENIEIVINQLEKDSNLQIKWEVDNSTRENPEKFNLLLDDADTNLSIKVDNYVKYEIKNSNEEKLLDIWYLKNTCQIFGYCPLVWMFHSRPLNNRINKIEERTLRLVYKDYNSTFNKLMKIIP